MSLGRRSLARTRQAQMAGLNPEPQFPLPAATLAPERSLPELLQDQVPTRSAILSPGHIRLYNVHTAERLAVTYRHGGAYPADAMGQISRFLRDWRSGEVFNIDPRVIDILASIQAHLGRSEPIYVTSGYRTRATNLLLASLGYEVARNSYHLHGKAIDFHQPGVALDGVRLYAASLQAGGVGYYPRDGFLHVDCGPLRHWTGNSHTHDDHTASAVTDTATVRNPG